MDEALQLVIEMNERTWQRFKADLQDVTPEETDWRPLPQANTINAILKHLRIEAEWYLKSIETGEQSSYRDTASVQQLTDSISLDFEQNLRELDELYTRFVAALRRTTLAALKQQTVLGPGLSRRCSLSCASSELPPGHASRHTLGTDPHHPQLVPEDAWRARAVFPR